MLCCVAPMCREGNSEGSDPKAGFHFIEMGVGNSYKREIIILKGSVSSSFLLWHLTVKVLRVEKFSPLSRLWGFKNKIIISLGSWVSPGCMDKLWLQ